MELASTRACRKPSYIGRLLRDGVAARTAPSLDARVVHVFNRTNVLGAPQVFLLVKRVLGKNGKNYWWLAHLPIRPNGTKAYLPEKALRLSKTYYRLTVERDLFRLRLFKRCQLLKTFKVGIGTGSTPTPAGRFYLAALLKVPNPYGPYGPYAYALSAYSETLAYWKLGGIVGLHGTNNPSSIGTRATHGCVRMYSWTITELVRILPLGTPIVIT